jgi:starch-binding outer membrane protein, SusD/RagB family
MRAVSAPEKNDKESSHMNSMRQHRRRFAGAGATLAVAVLLAGCDLTVTNPGPVQDSFLNDEGAYPAVLQGVRRGHAMAYTRLALDAAMMSFEGVPGGLFDTQFKQGILTSDNSDGNWNGPQRARWLAEDAAGRVEEALGGSFASNEFAAELLVHAGFANRTLGSNHCTAVFDEGPASAHTDYFTRAEAHFTQAISVANAAGRADLADAAQMGRADVRMWLGDWSGANSDATGVATDATFQMFFDDLDIINGGNEIMFRQASLPWREWTVWSTFAESYYTASGDPRMSWRTNPADPITMVDNLTFFVSTKFTDMRDPHTLASGWEMLLIQAENILVNDAANFANAMTLINQVRTRNISDDTGLALAPVVAANVTEAWAALKEERRIELYVEGRRFGDLRRWGMQSAPGTQPMEDMTGRSSCFPVGITEVNTNPNNLTAVTS